MVEKNAYSIGKEEYDMMFYINDIIALRENFGEYLTFVENEWVRVYNTWQMVWSVGKVIGFTPSGKIKVAVNRYDEDMNVYQTTYLFNEDTLCSSKKSDLYIGKLYKDELEHIETIERVDMIKSWFKYYFNPLVLESEKLLTLFDTIKNNNLMNV